MIQTSFGDRSKRVLDLGPLAFRTTVANPSRRLVLEQLGCLTDDMIKLLYGFTAIEDDTLDHDDEILNWTLPDVSNDLTAAIWATASGCYKAAAALLRNALDLGFAALYFQICQNDGPRNGYCEAFSSWDRGDADTPNWGTTKRAVSGLPTVQRFNRQYDCSVAQEAHNFFKNLCCFTHSRPYSPGENAGTNAMTMGDNSPEFDEALFARLVGLFQTTIAWICIPWVVSFPTLIGTRPLGSDATDQQYVALLNGEKGRQALEFAALSRMI